jgi:hypothetical protein
VLKTLEIPTDFIRAPVEVVAQLHKKSALECVFANGNFKEGCWLCSLGIGSLPAALASGASKTHRWAIPQDVGEENSENSALIRLCAHLVKEHDL